ncbi:hypothetical protein GN956_G1798 [Arapaima gigas]
MNFTVLGCAPSGLIKFVILNSGAQDSLPSVSQQNWTQFQDTEQQGPLNFLTRPPQSLPQVSAGAPWLAHNLHIKSVMTLTTEDVAFCGNGGPRRQQEK